ncbi:MAG: hypothetical protein ACREVE_15380 [Gammaproteobacteria bacterium]
MQRLTGGKILLPFAVAAILSACGGDGDDVTPPGPGPGPDPEIQGTLNLTVNGATANGEVFAQNASGAQTGSVEGSNTLDAGAYTLVVNGIREPGAIVDDLRTGTANQAAVTITAGGTQNRTVTYVAGGRRSIVVAGRHGDAAWLRCDSVDDGRSRYSWQRDYHRCGH